MSYAQTLKLNNLKEKKTPEIKTYGTGMITYNQRMNYIRGEYAKNAGARISGNNKLQSLNQGYTKAKYINDKAEEIYYGSTDPRKDAAIDNLVDVMCQVYPTLNRNVARASYKDIMKSSTGYDLEADSIWEIFGAKLKNGFASQALGLSNYLYVLGHQGGTDEEKQKMLEERQNYLTEAQKMRRTDYFDEYDSFIQKAILDSADVIPSQAISSALFLLGSLAGGAGLGAAASGLYNTLIEAGNMSVDLTNAGADLDTVLAFSSMHGIVAGSLEGTGEFIQGKFFDPLRQAISMVGKKTAGNLVYRTVGQMLGKYATNWAYNAFLGEPIEEILQDYSGMLFNNWALAYEEKNRGKSFREDYKNTEDDFRNSWKKTYLSTMRGTLVTGLAGNIGGIARDYAFGQLGKSISANSYQQLPDTIDEDNDRVSYVLSKAVNSPDTAGKAPEKIDGKTQKYGPVHMMDTPYGPQVKADDVDRFNWLKKHQRYVYAVYDTAEKATVDATSEEINDIIATEPLPTGTEYFDVNGKIGVSKNINDVVSKYVNNHLDEVLGVYKDGDDIVVNINGEAVRFTSEVGDGKKFDTKAHIQKKIDEDRAKTAEERLNETVSEATQENIDAVKRETEVMRDIRKRVSNAIGMTQTKRNSLVKQYADRKIDGMYNGDDAVAEKKAYDGLVRKAVDSLSKAMVDDRTDDTRFASDVRKYVKKKDSIRSLANGTVAMLHDFLYDLGKDLRWAEKHIEFGYTDNAITQARNDDGSLKFDDKGNPVYDKNFGFTYWTDKDGKAIYNPPKGTDFDSLTAHIDFTKFADQSTGIHEAGHVYLSMIDDISKLGPGFAEAFAEDIQKDKDEHIEGTTELVVGRHTQEAFNARLESYLNTGMEANEDVRNVFDTILAAVRKFVEIVREALTPKQKEYFDNLFERFNEARYLNTESKSVEEKVKAKVQKEEAKKAEVDYTQAMTKSIPVNDDDFNALRDKLKANPKNWDGKNWLAPNGKVSNLNEWQYVMVRTENFKNWFGDWENDPENASKVVDENGEPLELYHGGSSSDISEFKIGDRGYYVYGMYFTKHIESAKGWATPDTGYMLEIDNRIREREGLPKLTEDDWIYPVFLNIRNPNELNGMGNDKDVTLKNLQLNKLDSNKYYSNETNKYIRANIFNNVMKEANMEFTDEYGYDGFSVPYKGWFITLQPNQIKSATDNNGEFDPENPNIYRKSSFSNESYDMLANSSITISSEMNEKFRGSKWYVPVKVANKVANDPAFVGVSNELADVVSKLAEEKSIKPEQFTDEDWATVDERFTQSISIQKDKATKAFANNSIMKDELDARTKLLKRLYFTYRNISREVYDTEWSKQFFNTHNDNGHKNIVALADRLAAPKDMNLLDRYPALKMIHDTAETEREKKYRILRISPELYQLAEKEIQDNMHSLQKDVGDWKYGDIEEDDSDVESKVDTRYASGERITENTINAYRRKENENKRLAKELGSVNRLNNELRIVNDALALDLDRLRAMFGIEQIRFTEEPVIDAEEGAVARIDGFDIGSDGMFKDSGVNEIIERINELYSENARLDHENAEIKAEIDSMLENKGVDKSEFASAVAKIAELEKKLQESNDFIKSQTQNFNTQRNVMRSQLNYTDKKLKQTQAKLDSVEMKFVANEERLRDELENNKELQQTLDNERKASQKELEEVVKDLEESERKASRLSERNEVLERKVNARDERIEKYSDTMESLRTRIEDLRFRLSEKSRQLKKAETGKQRLMEANWNAVEDLWLLDTEYKATMKELKNTAIQLNTALSRLERTQTQLEEANAKFLNEQNDYRLYRIRTKLRNIANMKKSSADYATMRSIRAFIDTMLSRDENRDLSMTGEDLKLMFNTRNYLGVKGFDFETKKGKTNIAGIGLLDENGNMTRLFSDLDADEAMNLLRAIKMDMKTAREIRSSIETSRAREISDEADRIGSNLTGITDAERLEANRILEEERAQAMLEKRLPKFSTVYEVLKRKKEEEFNRSEANRIKENLTIFRFRDEDGKVNWKHMIDFRNIPGFAETLTTGNLAYRFGKTFYHDLFHGTDSMRGLNDMENLRAYMVNERIWGDGTVSQFVEKAMNDERLKGFFNDEYKGHKGFMYRIGTEVFGLDPSSNSFRRETEKKLREVTSQKVVLKMATNDEVGNSRFNVDVENRDILSSMLSESMEYSKDWTEDSFSMEEIMAFYEHSFIDEDLYHIKAHFTDNVASKGVMNILTYIDRMMDSDEWSEARQIAEIVQNEYGDRFDSIDALVSKLENRRLKQYEVYSATIVDDIGEDISYRYGEDDARRNYLSDRERGFTKLKTVGKNEMSLHYISDLTRVIESQESYIAGAELFDRWNEILNGQKVIYALRDRFGEKYSNAFMTNMKAIRRLGSSDVGTQSARIFSQLRNNLALSSLAFNVTTTLQQPAVWFLGTIRNGFGNMVTATMKASSMGFSNYVKMITSEAPQLINSRSATLEMARTSLFAPDSALGKFDEAKQRIADIGMHGIEKLDMLTRCIIYDATRTKIQSENNGMSEMEIINQATQFTLDVNSSGNAKDNSALYNSKNLFFKSLLMFTNQLNKEYNLLVGQDGIMGMKYGDKKVKDFVATVLALSLSATMCLLVKGKMFNKDDEESWLKHITMSYMSEGITRVPFIGKELEEAINGYNYADSSLASSMVNFIRRASDDEADSEKKVIAFKNFMNDAMEMTGLPRTLTNNIYNSMFEDGEFDPDKFTRAGWARLISYDWYEFINE